MFLKYFFAWFGMAVLAFANGALREFAYKPYVGELAAHEIDGMKSMGSDSIDSPLKGSKSAI